MNPYALDRESEWASSGPAQQLSGKFLSAGSGTEDRGSVTAPGFRTEWLGSKPTVWNVGQAGMFIFPHSQDTAGQWRRTVRVRGFAGAMAEPGKLKGGLNQVSRS